MPIRPYSGDGRGEDCTTHAEAEQDGKSHADEDDDPQGHDQMVKPLIDTGQRKGRLEGAAELHE